MTAINQLGAKQVVTKTVSMLINSSATSASSGDLAGLTVVGLYVPASIAGTTMTFTASYDGSTFFQVQNGSGSASTITISASIYIPFDPATFAGVRYLKLVSSSSETSKTFRLACRPCA